MGARACKNDFGFQSLSGLSLGLNAKMGKSPLFAGVSIPFRAVTGFERDPPREGGREMTFQSLSGLSLGLNGVSQQILRRLDSFNPFQGCHWV